MGVPSSSRPVPHHPRLLSPSPPLPRRDSGQRRPPPSATGPEDRGVRRTGADQVDKAECRRRGIAVTNAGNAYSEDVADLAVGLFLDVNRKISAADWYVRRGLWSSEGDYPLGSKVFIYFHPALNY